jgi:ribonuclease P/MRP protein subunit RPP40
VPSGVPQGSVLGPLLFSIFINDIGLNLRSLHCLFADDLKLYKISRHQTDMVELQLDLNDLNTWCEDNDMILNAAKCQVINFSRKISPTTPIYILNNCPIPLKSVIRDLGILLDSKLTFTLHYDTIICKANRTLGCVKRYAKYFSNLSTLTTLFMSLVRSTLEYGSVIWTPYYKIHVDRLEKVQHRFFKFIRWKLPSQISHSYSLSMCYLGLATLDVRRKYFALCFMYKIIHNLIDVIDLTQLLNFYVPQFPARNVPTFKLQHCRTNYMLYSSLNSLLRVCNMYADSIDLFRFHSYSVFWRHIKAILRC